MSGEPVTLEFIGRQLIDAQAERRAIFKELADLRSLVLLQVDQGRRTDRHIVELKDELELIIKAEVFGRIGIFESGVEKRLGELAERVEELETGKSRFTP